MTDDKMVEAFFGEAARMEIGDDGFSRRVMRNLESETARRLRRMSRLWTACCAVVGLVLLLASGMLGDMAAELYGHVQAMSLGDKVIVGWGVVCMPSIVAIAIAVYGVVTNVRSGNVLELGV